MSDGITDAYRKVSREDMIKSQLKYCETLATELQKALGELRREIEINKENEE